MAAWRKGPQKRHEMRLQRIARITAHGRQEARHLLRKREMGWLLGVGLYWAEGTKIKETHRSNDTAEFTNSDPAMIKIIRGWLKQHCAVADSDLKFSLYIHEKANILAAQDFWVRALGIDHAELHTYFKRHNPSPRSHNTGQSYYGTMRVRVRRSVNLSYRIVAWIQELVAWCGVG